MGSAILVLIAVVGIVTWAVILASVRNRAFAQRESERREADVRELAQRGSERREADVRELKAKEEKQERLRQEEQRAQEQRLKEQRERERAEKLAKEREEKELEEKNRQALGEATVWQTPGGRDISLSIKGFAETVWSVAGNEFEQRNTRGKVYRSTFGVNDHDATDDHERSRNLIILSKYDFDSQRYPCTFAIWHVHHKASKFGPETYDYCLLTGDLEMDASAAKAFRDSADRGDLSITVWYRLNRVKEADRQQNTHYTDARLAYNIQIDIEVLQYKINK